MYRLSLHAQRRIKQRGLKVEDLLAALNGRRHSQPNGNLILCDPLSRVTLVIDPKCNLVITALRMRPAKVKRLFRRVSNGG